MDDYVAPPVPPWEEVILKAQKLGRWMTKEEWHTAWSVLHLVAQTPEIRRARKRERYARKKAGLQVVNDSLIVTKQLPD